MIIVLHNQLWGSVEYGVGEMMVKSKFRGFVSSELPGVPNTREIRRCCKQLQPHLVSVFCMHFAFQSPRYRWGWCPSPSKVFDNNLKWLKKAPLRPNFSLLRPAYTMRREQVNWMYSSKPSPLVSRRIWPTTKATVWSALSSLSVHDLHAPSY